MKNKIMLFLSITFILAVGTYYNFQKAPSRKPASNNLNYCMAIRGNGELEPAHWGALARTVEQMGLPSAMAGGSSASISMFLLNSMAQHPLVQNQNGNQQKEQVSLLIKSLSGFFEELKGTKTWKDIQNLYVQYQSAQSSERAQITAKLLAAVNKKQWSEAQSTLQTAISLGFIDPVSFLPLKNAIIKKDLLTAQFYIQQFQETVAVFGKFNAESDNNLFFRPGLVSFDQLAKTFGKMASFYSANPSSNGLTANWKSFFATCAPDSIGLSWREIIQKKPTCSNLLHQLFIDHYAQATLSTPETEMIGSPIKVFPSTAVLTASASTQAKEALQSYHEKRDPQFGKDFKIASPEEVRFGYWGTPQDLAMIESRLDKSDEKSRRFFALGHATWEQVLSLSPAEPGLSPLKPFTTNGIDLVSAGGWSDLHPIAVLRASGCNEIIYLTRTGGESIFAQGVAKRLMNLDRDWSFLSTSEAKVKANTELNNSGDPSDLTSNWSKLYNLANPESSINRSLNQASAILCTNWNAFKFGPDISALVEDSYKSSYWTSDQFGLKDSLKPLLDKPLPGCQPFKK